ncbi:MAG: hypothetical protein BWY63_00158 [Chloroflexi bacterium ADurb.Bin360]|nr:MAG: hypothetical protein BWY63_00158 [Chloroflexi bacterium ADurb.Bin360]
MIARWWNRLLPTTSHPALRARASAILAACISISLAFVVLLLTWLLSGDLEGATVVAAGVFVAVLFSIGVLVRRGRVLLAGWLLTGILLLLITADVWSYGLGSPAAAGYIIPILLAVCALGGGTGMGVAVACSLSVWLLAWGEVAGWHIPYSPVEVSHLTFNAPALSVIFLIAAAIPGAMAHSLTPKEGT